MSQNDSIVVVGSGLAGWSLIREIRAIDKQRPIVLVTRDGGDFYSKPMLSNGVSAGKSATTLVVKPADVMARDQNVTLLSRAHAMRIDVDGRTLEIEADGRTRTLAYADLVLALGADPIRLPIEGDAASEVLSVNDLDDYAAFSARIAAIEAQADAPREIAILGAGLIGCEFANDLLGRGFAPTVFDLADRVLARLVPEQASRRLETALGDAGVTFRFGESLTRVDRAGESGRYRLTLAAHGNAAVSTIDADIVLSAIGLRPRMALAEQAGIAVQRGIVVTRALQTSAPHVYALGDVAEVDGLLLPYVMPLMQQTKALAATLCGTPKALNYPAMPVTVKTPICPTVVCPPAMNASVRWDVEEDAASLEGVATDTATGQRCGFVLMGEATKKKQQFASGMLGPWDA